MASKPPAEEVVVDFPFLMTIEHPPLNLEQMFMVSRAFDFYEMETDLSDNEGAVKEHMVVDVLEVTPKQTLLKITPAEPMAYQHLATHTKLMMGAVSKRQFKGQLKVTKIQWQVDKTGIASDMRGRLRTVA
jgi:hypothetical protein